MRAAFFLRRFVALLVVLALLLSPAIVALTHAPGAPEFAATPSNETLVHVHGHDHDLLDEPAGPDAHDPTDHDHQTYALLPTQTAALIGLRAPPDDAIAEPSVSHSHRGPERPPRSSIV